MAYVSQDLKKKLAPKIKQICKRYGVKATLAVRNHSTLCLNIKSGRIDFIGNFNATCDRSDVYGQRGFQPAVGSIDVNPYHYRDHFSGTARKFLMEVIPAMNTGNWDNSDIQTDYFDRGWYIDVNVGKWDKPYVQEV